MAPTLGLRCEVLQRAGASSLKQNIVGTYAPRPPPFTDLVPSR